MKCNVISLSPAPPATGILSLCASSYLQLNFIRKAEPTQSPPPSPSPLIGFSWNAHSTPPANSLRPSGPRLQLGLVPPFLSPVCPGFFSYERRRFSPPPPPPGPRADRDMKHVSARVSTCRHASLSSELTEHATHASSESKHITCQCTFLRCIFRKCVSFFLFI